jgi:hypothetical protein
MSGAAAVLSDLNNTIGTVANYEQVISAVIPLVEAWLQTGPTEMEVVLALQGTIQELVNAAGVIDADIKMLGIGTMASNVDAALTTVLNEGPNGQDVDAKGFFQLTLEFLTAMYGGSGFTDFYWYRPYLADRVFSPVTLTVPPFSPIGLVIFGWYGAPPEPPINNALYDGFSSVFDPQLSLLAFIKAIASFLSLNAILKTDAFTAFLKEWQVTLTEVAQSLQTRYSAMISGLARSDIPSVEDFAFFAAAYHQVPLGGVPFYIPRESFTGPGWAPQSGDVWDGVYGVVDIYSVYNQPVAVPSRDSTHIVDIFPPPTDINALADKTYDWIRDSLYPWVKDRVTLGIMARWKAIYLAKGYDIAWSVLQSLLRLTNQPNNKVDANRDWFARDLFSTLAVPASSSPGAPAGSYRLSDLVGRLDKIGRGSWNQPEDEVSPPSRPLGLRDRLSAAAA